MRSRLLWLVAVLFPALALAAAPIDRKALITRHNPVVRSVDVDAPLTVGNGQFAFTADITGLQTFAEYYHRNGIPTETEARWAWVTDENPNSYKLSDANKDFTLPDGRVLGFPTKDSSPAGAWLRRNPRALPVGQLELVWDKPDGSAFTPADIQEPEQTLDLWRGIITSKFKLGGVPVMVVTVCDPTQDALAVWVTSELVTTGKLRVKLRFPRGYDPEVKNTPGLDWSHPEAHRSVEKPLDDATESIQRSVGGLNYFVVISGCAVKKTAVHEFLLTTGDQPGDILQFSIGFAPGDHVLTLRSPTTTMLVAATNWEEFWTLGAAVDFSGSTNPLAQKLEERIILSRYLTAVQLAGDVPPQESGLTCSTWYGKHHTEMIWWHTAQFALWGNDALLEKNLDWFRAQLPAARELAKSRGLDGARWAKMTGPEMR
ncbi:MAG TPA: hypothetical protein VFJ90_12175, partial [Candidatus Didemnitutus sp.]|nr:hypothetical protein [Candidatus Didemnitutus sp.]